VTEVRATRGTGQRKCRSFVEAGLSKELIEVTELLLRFGEKRGARAVGWQTLACDSGTVLGRSQASRIGPVAAAGQRHRVRARIVVPRRRT